MSARRKRGAPTLTEAFYGDRMRIMRDAVRAKFPPDYESSRYTYFVDLDDEYAIFELDGWADLGYANGYYRCAYTRAADESVVLGELVEPVNQVTSYTTEALVISGRVLEAKPATPNGERVFRMQVIEAGRSENARHYPMSTLIGACEMYDGAKVFDHHRADYEYLSSTIEGLVGYLRNPTMNSTGIEADLHVFASATHVVEALSASLVNQSQGVIPLVGMSHNALAKMRPITYEGRVEIEATEIVRVLSADVVSDPAAGGKAIRVVAGGSSRPTTTPTKGKKVDFDEIVEALGAATPEQKATLAESLGLSVPKPATEPTTTAVTGPTGTLTISAPVTTTTEADTTSYAFDSIIGEAVFGTATAKLSERGRAAVKNVVGDRFTEAELRKAVKMVEGLDVPTPTVPHVAVTGDEHDKKIERLDASFNGDWRKGYRSLKEAYLDVTGQTSPRDVFSGDFNRQILAESAAAGIGIVGRVRESVTVSSWGQILGDSITRRLLKMYGEDDRVLQALAIVRETPLSDFRTQRRVRMGGYGVLPTVLEGGPYQPLTSPTDEEATYAPVKKGGTEDLTIETIMADDLGAVVRIPALLSRAAGETLHEFVFTFLSGNAAVYDAVALFDAAHANTAAAALSDTALTAGKVAMMKQGEYGNAIRLGTSNRPKFLVVPPDLMGTAYWLTSSERAVPSSPPAASDMPNMQRDLSPLVVSFLTDTNDWFLVADPALVDGLELGWVFGPDPQLFVQDQPNVGSTFNADKITYKIRHGYGAAVVDYRAFYRGTQ